jgi:hypothetical protein
VVLADATARAFSFSFHPTTVFRAGAAGLARFVAYGKSASQRDTRKQRPVESVLIWWVIAT